MSGASLRTLLLAVCLMIGAPAQADQYLKSVSPKASIDGFLAVCRGFEPDSACRCLVRNMVQSREGDFLVDSIATARRMDNIQKSVGMERVKALAARHNIGREEALAILAAYRSYIEAAADGCS